MDKNCLFCKIVTGDIPSQKVYEDETVVAFRDIDPQAPEHILLIPRRHIPTTLDLAAAERELVGHIFLVAGQLARKLGFAEAGFRIVNNCNAAGGQLVWHLHFHLLAGRQMGWPPG
ncbi:MAG: histidine triad nucleotide-binding protein [Deltaproteobacteria bacterium]|nr:histidine triad nucleotide-binding protein [Deltaproteobacteria bacterium]